MYKHGLGTAQACHIHPAPPRALSLSPTPTPAAASTAIDKFTIELSQSNCSSHHAPSLLPSWHHHETPSRPGYSTPYQSRARTAVLELHRKPPWLQATCANLIILFSATSRWQNLHQRLAMSSSLPSTLAINLLPSEPVSLPTPVRLPLWGARFAPCAMSWQGCRLPVIESKTRGQDLPLTGVNIESKWRPRHHLRPITSRHVSSQPPHQ